MQLQFTTEELQFLADILEARDEELRSEIAQLNDAEANRVLEKERQILSSAEDQVIDRDLHFSSEELDLLGRLVARRYGEAVKKAEQCGENAQKPGAELEVLQHIQERLAETCAMF